METPTAAQLRTAIEVLTKLDERINIEADYFVTQLPEMQPGTFYAENIKGRALKQTIGIQAISMQLKRWHNELLAERTEQIFVRPLEWSGQPNFRASLTNLWSWIKKLTAIKMPPKTSRVT